MDLLHGSSLGEVRAYLTASELQAPPPTGAALFEQIPETPLAPELQAQNMSNLFL